MKKVMLLAIVLVVGLSFSAFAKSLVEVPNKICPVSHEQVGKDGMVPYKVTYKGKVYHLCCKMCVKNFNKDPEKYVKIMEAEVVGKKADKKS